MKREQVKALLLLAGIDVLSLHEVANKYWPQVPEYTEIRSDNPWWLVETQQGLVEIGWRKRVISINWERTPIRVIVTVDNVTKSEAMVHAWSYADALRYLTEWKILAARERGE